MSDARFVLGIDLGTTGSVVASVDTAAEKTVPDVLGVPQLVAAGVIETRKVLPSYLYLPGPGDSEEKPFAGEWARGRGADVPTRLVSSAKSWLCHPAVDLTEAILPWGAGEDVQKVSPVDASARYLEHLAAAWNEAHPDAPIADQDVFLTVPASFDAVARELTLQAARKAGLGKVTLLEEPQAAFYAWLAQAGDGWRKQLRVGDVVLVCDIGGGTTDFTLIEVRDRGGELELERVAVGDHILLGGDNMDLALSYALAQRLAAEGTKLDTWQQRALTHACRGAKEQLLSAGDTDRAQVAILGRGSKLVGGTVKVGIERADVEKTLVNGFFPPCEANARPARTRRVGLKELGLPYAADAAVTRHLAEFVGRHGKMPTAILYNGGVMKGVVLRNRLAEVVKSWTEAGVKELGGTDLDLAVAHGAAYYGMVRRGKGIRIRGGAARSYYIGIEKSMPAVPGMPAPLDALCVVPFGMEEGTEADVPARDFGLVVGEPAEFRFFGSSVRKDRLGEVIEDLGDDLEELAPVEAQLPATSGSVEGTVVPVRLHTHLTEVGTLELWCVSKEDARKWKLEFNVRAATE
jgi:molecular chaperone DnaK (HSP70)